MKLDIRKLNWRTIPCKKTELQLEPTLNGGQSFRWKKLDDTWMGVFKNRVWILSQTENTLLYQCFKSCNEEMKEVNSSLKSRKRKQASLDDEKEDEILLKNYFRLDINLTSYYDSWSKLDPYFEKASAEFYGIRMLNQDVIENLFSFICSSNNNIARISSMVEKLCTLYGTKITKINGITYFNFPEINKLCSSDVESDLREAGFGYRAKFIYQSACIIKNFGGEKWLEKLKTLPYQEAKEQLIKLPGIGAKVADCISLMSLGHLEAIPVDTHIFQVASNIYLPHLKTCKSVTDKVYNEISTYFRRLYGDKAGWAHTILFCSHLKTFQKSTDKKNRRRKIMN